MHYLRPAFRNIKPRLIEVAQHRAYASRPPSDRKPPNFLALIAILGLGFGAFSIVSKKRASDPYSTRKGNQFSKAGVTPTPEGMADQERSQAKLGKGGPEPAFDSSKIAVVGHLMERTVLNLIAIALCPWWSRSR